MININNIIHKFMIKYSIPQVHFVDIIQIIILSFVIYQMMLFLKKTQAWTLLKGVILLVVITFVIKIANFTVLFWIISKSFNIILIVTVVVFHPEIRSALDRIGRRRIVKMIFSNNENIEEKFNKECVEEIVRACDNLSSTKTGALIVIEAEVPLNEIEKTGIKLDALISSELIINTFEHNTPLHDGAMIIRGNKIVSATCYLPLSKNKDISKALGTRHRAGIGITETSDATCIIVSEETGKITVANKGLLIQVTPIVLKKHLLKLVKTEEEESVTAFKFFKGFLRNGKNNKK